MTPTSSDWGNWEIEAAIRLPPSAPAVAALLTGVAVLAFIVRWAGIDQEPLHDELYNYLAAKAWLERGSLSIVPGAEPYLRGRFFTLLISWMMGVFGPTLAVARMASVIAGTAVATLVAWWLARNGLMLAALVAGGLVALDPELLQLSQISRFYAVQHLAFLVGAIAFARAVEWERPFQATLLAVVGGTALTLALHLQIITIVGIGGLVAFAVLWPESYLNRRGREWFHRYPLGLPAAVIGLLGIGFLAAWLTGVLAWMIDMASYSALWAEGNRDNARFYYAWLHDHYSPLVVLFPLLLLLSWVRSPRITAISLAVFGVAFIAHSSMAWKSNRYLSYALPFFFVIGSIGAVEGARRLSRAVPRLVAQLKLPERTRRATSLAMLSLIIISLVIGNRGFLATARILTRDPLTHFPLMNPRGPEMSWSLAQPVLDSLATESRVLVSSNPLKAVLFLGRLDYILSLSALHGRNGRQDEFWLDPRFDRPAIIEPESLARIQCTDDALVIVEPSTFGNRNRFSQRTVDYLRSQGTEPSMPPRTGLHVFLLNRNPVDECANLTTN